MYVYSQRHPCPPPNSSKMFDPCHDHVLDLVASHLDVRDLTGVACVDRRWRDVCRPRIEDTVRAEFDRTFRSTIDAIINRHWADGMRAVLNNSEFHVPGYDVTMDPLSRCFRMNVTVDVCGVLLIITTMCRDTVMLLNAGTKVQLGTSATSCEPPRPDFHPMASLRLATREAVTDTPSPSITMRMVDMGFRPPNHPRRNIGSLVFSLIEGALHGH